MAKHEEDIGQFIKKVKSTPAYTDNKKVRDLVDESENRIREAAASGSKNALVQALGEMKLRLVVVFSELNTGSIKPEKVLPPDLQVKLLNSLKLRFEAHMERHNGIKWADVLVKLESVKDREEKLWSLNEMERTGGEPDVVGFDKETGEYIFMDCSSESPGGRRLVCYDREGQELAEMNGNKPEGNAIDMAKAMGIEILNETEYRGLQKKGRFDLNTWSWLKTPVEIRKAGSAFYVARDGDGVDVGQRAASYHDGIRGFRGSLRV